MNGIHPDVIFGEARLAMGNEPYVSAMDKFRARNAVQGMRPKEIRAMLLSSPETYDLTPSEIEAVKRIADQK